MLSTSPSITTTVVTSCILEPTNALSLLPMQLADLILILRSEKLLARFALRAKETLVLNEFPANIRRQLCNAIDLAAIQRNQVQSEAALLKTELARFSDVCIFLKGAAYTLAGLKCSQGRTYSDIDILTLKESLSTIEKRMLFSGWISQPISNYDQKYYRQWAHEIPPLIHAKRKTVIDVHHNLVPPVSGRAPDISHFLQQIESRNGFDVLSPAGMVLHSAIHLVFNEDFSSSYRDMFDIHFLIEECQSSAFWQALYELAQKSGFENDLFLALRYTQQYIGTSLPDEVNALTSYGPLRLRFLDSTVGIALAPKHALCHVDNRGLASFFAYCRGHILKMPMHILIYHTVVKSTRALFESVFGKHVFLSKENRVR